ncbi:MAG TPA: hypothetical protein VHT91_08175 [Kofleriaceae bacterium]|nr:hypothetical protein [Kofleriaceae bacterium]
MTGAACFGCGARDQLQEVGDTVFCPACLGRMLRRVDERTAESPGGRGRGGPIAGPADRVPAGRALLARTPAADALCFLCGDPLNGQGFVELRGFSICAGCSRSLVSEDPADGDGDAGDPPINGRSFAAGAGGEAAVLEDRSELDAAGSAQRPAAAAPIWTPGSSTEWCTRCGRAMPGPGSYVLIDGRPHCAACAAARMRDGLRRGDPPASAEVCDACDRALGAGPVAETEGFRLCAACLHSDRELALALARARHQRRLARASRRVLDGDDD